METTFDFAVISRNEYYRGFLITLETAALHSGELPGTDLKAQLERMNHYLIVQDFHAPIIWTSIDSASKWAVSKGYAPVTSHLIYHQDGRIFAQSTL